MRPTLRSGHVPSAFVFSMKHGNNPTGAAHIKCETSVVSILSQVASLVSALLGSSAKPQEAFYTLCWSSRAQT